MKLKLLVIAVLFTVFVHGMGFAQEENAETWNGRAVQYFNQGNYAKAIECFLEAKTIIEKTFGKEHPHYASSINNLGTLYYRIGDYAKAEIFLLEARAVYEKVLGKEHPDYATSLNNLGGLYENIGEYAKAESCYLESRAIREKVLGKEHPSYANSLNNLGTLYYSTGDYAKAESCFLESRTIREKVLGKEHPDYAQSLNNLGGLYKNIGEYAKAENCYLESGAIYEKTFGREHPFYATSANNLGALYENMGEYAKAESFYLESRDIYERVLGKEHPSYAGSLNNLGELYRNMGEYAKAESYYLESRAILEKVLGKEHPSYASSLNNLGLLYDSMDNYTKAESFYLEARAIREKILGKEHPDYATSLNNLGVLYLRMGDYAKAESCHLESKAIVEKVMGKEHPSYAGSLNNLGGLYDSMGDYAKAESCYLESRAIYEKLLGKEHPSYASSLNNLYTLYLNKEEYTQAIRIKQEQIKLHASLINRNFAFLSEQQRTDYWNINSRSFEGSYSLSFFHPIPASNILNYDNALFTKGLLLRTTNAVRDAVYSSDNKALIAQFEELGRLRQQISALRQSGGNEAYIRSLEGKAETLDKYLTQASASYKDFNADFNWQRVRNSLQAKEAAIEFVSFRLYDRKGTNTHYAALVVKPGVNAPEWVPLCEESVISELFTKLDGEKPQKQADILYNEYGSALYDAIWRPLEKTLVNASTVYYSPSGLLHKVAFSAIPVNADSRLMDKYNLNMVSSTREVVSIKNGTSGKPGSAVVYGGLEYNVDAASMRREALAYNVSEPAARINSVLPKDGSRGGAWNYLFWTKEESRDIQRLLEENKIPVTLYDGAKGNKESFKNLSAKKIPVIHLATHGFFIQDIEKNYGEKEQMEQFGLGEKAFENPLLRSGLILAGGNNAWAGNPVEGVENGILFADDIAQMNLVGTDLVVLSACETGLGAVNNSEGVFGLQRAFKLAGTRTLIMSLWEVDDEGTGVIMNEFYRNWLSGKSKQEAFKNAQRNLRSNSRYASPFYWAGFVLLD